MPVENLLTPDYLRRILWKPPAADREEMEAAVSPSWEGFGARPWQIEIIAPMMAAAILHPKPAPS